MDQERAKAAAAWVLVRTGGGGGFGPAHTRDPQAVANDVRQGYVSREQARDVYRVVLDADGRVDRPGTRARRERRRCGGAMPNKTLNLLILL